MFQMFRKRTRRHILIALLALLMLPLASCDWLNSGAGSTRPIKGGSVVDAFQQEPDMMLPWFTSSTFAVMAQTTVWAPLWYGDLDGTFHAGLATQVPGGSNGGVAADLKSITIKLRSGLHWSDGSPLTAEDCAFTFDLVSNPAAASLGFPLKTADDPIGFVSATAVDTRTFKLTFQNANAGILFLLADAAATCLPKKVFGSVAPADITKSPEAFKPTVSSGPFTVSERVAGDHTTVKKNPKYYQGPNLPHLDQINIKIITDPSTILAGFHDHTIDAGWWLPTERLDTYRMMKSYTTGLDKGAGYEWLIFNLKNPILADLQVRQALTMSIKPADLYQAVYHGAARATCDDHAGTFAHEAVPTGGCYKYDPTAAGQILDADGWTLGPDGYRHKDGKTLEFTYLTTIKAARKQTEAIFQVAWKKVGIKVDLEPWLYNCSFGDCMNVLCRPQWWDISDFAGGGVYEPDDHTSFVTGQDCAHGGTNYSGYSNPIVDQAEQAQMSSADQGFRKQQFHIIHQQILHDLPVMYLFVPQDLWVHANRLHNYNPSGLGAAEMWNVWDWWMSAT